MAGSSESFSPPYLPYATFRNTVRTLAQDGKLPARIDASILSTMSGSNRALFLAALKWFEMTDQDGVPTSLMKEMAVADEKLWNQQLADLLRKHYSAQLKPLASGTPSQLRESFSPLSGSVLEKSVRFLVSAATEAGVEISAHHKRPRVGGGASSGQRRKQKGRKPQAGQDTSAPRSKGMRSFPIHIPGKPEGQILVPDEADSEDVPLLEAAFNYVKVVLERQKGGN